MGCCQRFSSLQVVAALLRSLWPRFNGSGGKGKGGGGSLWTVTKAGKGSNPAFGGMFCGHAGLGFLGRFFATRFVIPGENTLHTLIERHGPPGIFEPLEAEIQPQCVCTMATSYVQTILQIHSIVEIPNLPSTAPQRLSDSPPILRYTVGFSPPLSLD